MNDEIFNELCDSVKEAGKIVRGEIESSRITHLISRTEQHQNYIIKERKSNFWKWWTKNHSETLDDYEVALEMFDELFDPHSNKKADLGLVQLYNNLANFLEYCDDLYWSIN